MSLGRRFAPLMFALIAAAWLSALDQGMAPGAVAGAVISTGLATTLLLLARPALRAPRMITLPQKPRGESEEFRRELRHLCAALKLSVGFCERNPEAELDLLLQEVEEMGDNIRAFSTRLGRPIRLFPRTGCAADLSRPSSAS